MVLSICVGFHLRLGNWQAAHRSAWLLLYAITKVNIVVADSNIPLQDPGLFNIPLMQQQLAAAITQQQQQHGSSKGNNNYSTLSSLNISMITDAT
ncbi:hypothetical protein ACA910_004558 [Epithemia clementina (nom. ined.)]